jgi:cytochrome c peroxidase
MMMKKLTYTLLVTGIIGVTSFSAQAEIEWKALPDNPPVPQDNPQTDAKVNLGKALYFDTRLSVNGALSCNSCHNVMAGGDDSRPNSVGVGDARGGRGAPTVWNAAFQTVQFWDGRAASLEEQAKGPVTNPIEMGMKDWDAVIERLKQIPGYKPMFEEAFGKDNPITADNAAKSIAAYERTLITPNSPYDRYVKGDKTALSEDQVKGMNTFAEVGCVSCHIGANFSGPELPMGQGFFMKFPTFGGSQYETKYKLGKDLGRFEATKDKKDKHFWRVPTLRNVALTAPYFHNGEVKTLDEAVRVMGKVQLNKELEEQQVKDIVAFLNALTGEFPQQTMPTLPPTPGMTLIPADKK